MSNISELLYMKMDNGELVYGTNLDIGKYSVKHDCECEEDLGKQDNNLASSQREGGVKRLSPKL